MKLWVAINGHQRIYPWFFSQLTQLTLVILGRNTYDNAIFNFKRDIIYC